MDINQLDTYLQKLTPHQFKILQLLYDANGEWLTRAKVAKGLGKRRLTPYDINCLTTLTEQNILAESTQPTTAPGSDFAYIYAMPDEVADLLAEWSEHQHISNSSQKKEPRKPINLTGQNEA